MRKIFYSESCRRWPMFGVACLIAVKTGLPETIPRDQPRITLSKAMGKLRRAAG